MVASPPARSVGWESWRSGTKKRSPHLGVDVDHLVFRQIGDDGANFAFDQAGVFCGDGFDPPLSLPPAVPPGSPRSITMVLPRTTGAGMSGTVCGSSLMPSMSIPSVVLQTPLIAPAAAWYNRPTSALILVMA
jgi:hypothetical protein